MHMCRHWNDVWLFISVIGFHLLTNLSGFSFQSLPGCYCLGFTPPIDAVEITGNVHLVPSSWYCVMYDVLTLGHAYHSTVCCIVCVDGMPITSTPIDCGNKVKTPWRWPLVVGNVGKAGLLQQLKQQQMHNDKVLRGRQSMTSDWRISLKIHVWI